MKIKKILKIILWIILVPALALGLIIAYAAITDYRPAEKVVLYTNDAAGALPDSAAFNLMTWNIGYCGLGSNMDFFYDGGTHVRTTAELTNANIQAVKAFLKANDSLNFILLQEVDLNSRRSYHTNQLDSFAQTLPSFSHFLGMNYDVFFVPVPFTNPYGSIKSGIVTFSAPKPCLVERYSYPSKFPFPKNLFMLDRCFVTSHYKLAGGKELLLINTHNSAYDPGGKLRTKEMEYFKNYLLREYEKGNYVIVGGDWNQSPAGFKPEFTGHPFDTIDVTYVPDAFLPPEWTWFFDKTVPSNRRVLTPYDAATTATTVIDFYLLSPNVAGIKLKTIDLGFANSDHHPVIARMKLGGRRVQR